MSTLRKDGSSLIYNLLQILLLLLNIIFIPYSVCVTLSVLLFNKIGLIKAPRRILAKNAPRVLVSGVGMSKGLFVARSMYLGGCDVFGIEFDNYYGNLYFGRFSRSLQRFFPVPDPAIKGVDAFISRIIDIVKTEKIDLWISCSRVTTPIEDAMLAKALCEQTNCKVFQFDEEVTSTLDDKLSFMRKTSELGIARAQWYSLTGYHDIHDSLENIKKSTVNGRVVKFIIKSANFDDSIRNRLPLLSSDNLQAAEKVMKALDFSHNRHWIVQEFIESQEEYCTNALVVNGKVRAFTATESCSILLHYQRLNPDSMVYENMLRFTQKYAASLGDITGHLSFDFLVSYQRTDDGFEANVVPIECNPRCHTAVILFHGKEVELADRYLESLYGTQNSSILETKPIARVGQYWMCHDLVTLGALPILRLISGLPSSCWIDEVQRILRLIDHLITWKDQTFLWWDPLPWFAMNHLYWPPEILRSLYQGIEWIYLNVSTGKIMRK